MSIGILIAVLKGNNMKLICNVFNQFIRLKFRLLCKYRIIFLSAIPLMIVAIA